MSATWDELAAQDLEDQLWLQYLGETDDPLAPEQQRFPRVEWFPGLEGVLPMRELVGFYGPGDSYKSFTAQDWACHIARQSSRL
jgi:hypothetical protein